MPDRALVALAALGLTLNATGLGWGLPPSEYFAWDVDGVAPLQPLVAAKRMFIDDWWNSGYYNKFPMGHFFVLMAAYAPYLGYLALTGGLARPSEMYPFGLTDPETALTVLSLIARGVSAVMGAGIVVLVYLTVRRLAGRRAAVFAGLTIALSPAFIYYAHTGNVDTPSVFWSALALHAFARLVDGPGSARTYGLLGGAVAMAAATKEQTVGLFLLVPALVLVLHARDHEPGAALAPAALRAAVDRKVLGGLLACVVTFGAATHLVFNWDGNVKRLRWRLFKEHPTVGDAYPRTIEFDSPLEGLGQLAATTCDVLNPVLFLAGVAGLFLLPLRRRWARFMAVPLLSYAALTVVMLDRFRPRFALEAALVLAMLGGPVLAVVWTRAIQWHRAMAAPVLLVWIYAFLYGAEVDYLLLRDARYAAEDWLRAEARPGARVEVFTGPVYLPRFPRDMEVVERDFTLEAMARLPQRTPDLVVLTSVHSDRMAPGSPDDLLLARLLAGEFGYRPLKVFERDPVVGPRIIPGVSPRIVVLGHGVSRRSARGARPGS